MAHALQRLMATGMMGKRLQKGHLGGDCQTPTPAYPGDIKERGTRVWEKVDKAHSGVGDAPIRTGGVGAVLAGSCSRNWAVRALGHSCSRQ